MKQTEPMKSRPRLFGQVSRFASFQCCGETDSFQEPHVKRRCFTIATTFSDHGFLPRETWETHAPEVFSGLAHYAIPKLNEIFEMFSKKCLLHLFSEFYKSRRSVFELYKSQRSVFEVLPRQELARQSARLQNFCQICEKYRNDSIAKSH